MPNQESLQARTREGEENTSVKSACKATHERRCSTSTKRYCIRIGGRAVGIEMPKKSEKLQMFENHQKQKKLPYVIYSDLESLITKVDTCLPNPKVSSTEKTSLHQ